jgi:RNA polymerase sigma factor (sigma-70 family)
LPSRERQATSDWLSCSASITSNWSGWPSCWFKISRPPRTRCRRCLQAKRDRPGREELAYLRACVLNGCRSVLRRRTLTRRIDASFQVLDDGATSESAESAAIRSQLHHEVLAALAALPTRRREVLVLRYFLGLSESEIASTLGISNGSVKSAAARGLASLARALGEEPS